MTHWRRVLPGAAAASLALHAALIAMPFGPAADARLAGTSHRLNVLLREDAEAAAPDIEAPQASRWPSAPARAALSSSMKPPHAHPFPVAPAPVVYYKASQLTEAPRPLEEPPLDALEPYLSRAGSARMRLFIDQGGNVEAIDVEGTTLPAEVAWRATALFSHVRFSPGRIDGVPVRSQIAITVGAAESRSYGR